MYIGSLRKGLVRCCFQFLKLKYCTFDLRSDAASNIKTRRVEESSMSVCQYVDWAEITSTIPGGKSNPNNCPGIKARVIIQAASFQLGATIVIVASRVRKQISHCFSLCTGHTAVSYKPQHISLSSLSLSSRLMYD